MCVCVYAQVEILVSMLTSLVVMWAQWGCCWEAAKVAWKAPSLVTRTKQKKAVFFFVYSARCCFWERIKRTLQRAELHQLWVITVHECLFDCVMCVLHLQRMRSGSTGVAVLLAADWLTVSWLGDSQAMLVKKGEPVILMDPHKPEREVRYHGREVSNHIPPYR